MEWGDLMSRIAELLVMADDDNKNAQKWFELGRFAVDRYVIGIGLQAMRNAADLDPNNVEILDYFARALNRARELNEAVEVYERALGIDPSRASLWAGYAVVQGHIGNLRKSSEYFKKAVEMDPGNAWGVFGHSTHMGLSGQRNAIIPLLNRAVEANPASGQLWMYLSDMLRMFGDTEGSRVALAEAIARMKDSHPDEHRRGLSMMVRSERSSEAIRIAREIIKEDPDNLGVYGPMISWCADNDPIEGKKLLEYALKLDPNNSSIKPDGAKLLMKTGDIRGAFNMIESIRQDMPNSPVADALLATLTHEYMPAKEQLDDIPLALEFLLKKIDSSQSLIEKFELDKHKDSIQMDLARKEARRLIDGLRGLYSTTVWHVYVKLWEKEGWSFVRNRMKEALERAADEEKFLLKVGILDSLGMVEFAGFDGDFVNILTSVRGSAEQKEVSDQLYTKLVESVRKQIDDGGPSIFLDIERLAYTEGASLIPIILDARNRELEHANLIIQDKRVDLTELWKTSYGFDILTALDMRQETDMFGLERIRSSMEAIGLPVHTDAKTTRTRLSISDELWAFIKNHMNRSPDESE